MTDSIDTLELAAELRKVAALAIDAEQSLHSRLSSRWEAREYLFDGPANFTNVANCFSTLDDWRRLDAHRDIKRMHIIFNGSAGMIQAVAMHDYIRGLRQDGFTVVVEIAGRADRQAALILAAASEKVMTESSWLRIEEVGMGVEGNTFDAENEIAFNDRLEAQMRRLLCEGSKVTPRMVAARTRLKTWNVSAQDALKLGLIHRISTSRPEWLVIAKPTNFEAIPEAETIKQQLSVAAIRKMRAEGMLAELNHRDKECSGLINGVVRYINSVDTTTANVAKGDLNAALRLSSSDIQLVIDCNGGSCTDGLGFIDMCHQVNASGRALDTICYGYAASMGGVMLSSGRKRKMGKESWLLIHRVSSWFGPTTTGAKLSKQHCTELQLQCFGMLAARSKLTAEQILEKCKTHDWWLTAEEALKYGFIDEIV
jgi:ATP-dependent Clp endopeptidase proteolytic subunit ClpP